LWLHSLKVAQLLRSAACLHTNQSRSYLNHLVIDKTHRLDLLQDQRFRRFLSYALQTSDASQTIRPLNKSLLPSMAFAVEARRAEGQFRRSKSTRNKLKSLQSRFGTRRPTFFKRIV